MSLIKCYKVEILGKDLSKDVPNVWAVAAPRWKRSHQSSSSNTTTSRSTTKRRKISERDPDAFGSGSIEEAWTSADDSDDSFSLDELPNSELGCDDKPPVGIGLETDIGTPLQDGSNPAIKCTKYLYFL